MSFKIEGLPLSDEAFSCRDVWAARVRQASSANTKPRPMLIHFIPNNRTYPEYERALWTAVAGETNRLINPLMSPFSARFMIGMTRSPLRRAIPAGLDLDDVEACRRFFATYWTYPVGTVRGHEDTGVLHKKFMLLMRIADNEGIRMFKTAFGTAWGITNNFPTTGLNGLFNGRHAAWGTNLKYSKVFPPARILERPENARNAWILRKDVY